MELNAAEGGKETERERERVKMKDEIGEFFAEQLTEQGGFFLYTGMLVIIETTRIRGGRRLTERKARIGNWTDNY